MLWRGSDLNLFKFILNVLRQKLKKIKKITAITSDKKVLNKLINLKKKYFNSKNYILDIYFKPSNLVNLIDKSNLIIVSGGGITHEINCRSKKMNIISLNKNQILQCNRWKYFGHNYLGNWNRRKNNLTKKINNILNRKKNDEYIKQNIFTNKTDQIIKDAIKIIR